MGNAGPQCRAGATLRSLRRVFGRDGRADGRGHGGYCADGGEDDDAGGRLVGGWVRGYVMGWVGLGWVGALGFFLREREREIGWRGVSGARMGHELAGLVVGCCRIWGGGEGGS